MINFTNVDNRVPVTPDTPATRRKSTRTDAAQTVQGREKVFVERRRKADRRSRKNSANVAFERRMGPDRRRAAIKVEV